MLAMKSEADRECNRRWGRKRNATAKYREQSRARAKLRSVEGRRAERIRGKLRVDPLHLVKLQAKEQDKTRKGVAIAYAAHLKAGTDYQRRVTVSIKRGGFPKSSAEAWRYRYANDPIFREKEIQRLKTAKLKRRGLQVPGISSAETRALYAEFSCCPYCNETLTFDNRTLDHMDPLSRGGIHAASNLVVCCTTCNTRKAAKPFMRWAMSLPAEIGQRVIAIKDRKYKPQDWPLEHADDAVKKAG